MNKSVIDYQLNLLGNSISFIDDKVTILDIKTLRQNIGKLAEISALSTGEEKDTSRYLIRKIGLTAGVYPASIHGLYIARGEGKVPTNFTVPAINLRGLTFDAARAVFRAAIPIEANALIFEIARSEMGYTDQVPSEYASSILAAAVAEGYEGPVFIQGDHFQVSLGRFTANRDSELKALKELIIEAIGAGFFNIDIDTSTLVNLEKQTIHEQQELNSSLSAYFTDFIRNQEPSGITISVGGEIGEVGGHNSTEEELRAYMDLYIKELEKLNPQAVGLSKISIQTGTSHGGVVLPDGTIAKVNVDFDTLLNLSQVAREEYALGGAVQHGASTLPEEAFGKFTESEACEVHLATNFQNIMFNLLPDDLRAEMYEYLEKEHSNDRKPGMTDDQFYYVARKRAIGPFKSKTWKLPEAEKNVITSAWEEQFKKLFTLLNISGTMRYTEATIEKILVEPEINNYRGVSKETEDVSDLAD